MANQDKKLEVDAGDSRKRHGDKLGAATRAPESSPSTQDRPQTGDSPKRQGDPMEGVVRGGKG